MKKSGIQTAIGRRVRLLRERERMSRGRLATEADMAPYTLAKIETGVSDPKISTLEKIAHTLRVPIGELLEDIPSADRGRRHRRAVNDLVSVLLAQDEDTVNMLSDMIETALSLKRKARR